MSVSIATLELLVNAGLSGDALLNVVRSIEADNTKPVRTKNAERQARHRERVKNNSVTRNVTDNAIDNVTAPPSSLSLSPTPPNLISPTPSPPYSPPAPRKPSKAELDAIWSETPAIARQRSGRADLERSLTAAMRRGANPADVLVGIRAAYASTSYAGDMAKGVHRLIEGDRWRGFVEDAKPPDWQALVDNWRATGRWASSLGPPPDHPETQVPQQLRAA